MFNSGHTKLDSCLFDNSPTLRAYLTRIWHIQHLLWLQSDVLSVALLMANVRLEVEGESVWLFEPMGPQRLSLVHIRLLI